jgi:Flp pilus assembly CpaF family ATPase
VAEPASSALFVDDLISRGTLTRSLADYLSEQISNCKTLLISGGTGTGKTTLLNILAQAIPEQERIIVIEDTTANSTGWFAKVRHLPFLVRRDSWVEPWQSRP